MAPRKEIKSMTYKNIFSVTQLTTLIKQNLEGAFPQLSVQGEVGNLRKQASGHIYFTLKDSSAQLSCVLFRGNAMRLSSEPKEGDQIVASGELSVYPPRGGYQMVVRGFERSGVGELLKTLHERKLKLEQLGWFARETKKPLPLLPKTVGVVTSSTGSVIQDILHVLSRRFSGFHLILNPVRVQGEGAALEIAKAIEEMDRHQLADVLIVGRGGGSLEDLWPFNEEVVARAIHNCRTPVVSAVGHETDVTIADFVADLRAPTPSAAAELVMEEKAKWLDALAKLRRQLTHVCKAQLDMRRTRLASIAKHPVMRSPFSLLSTFLQKVDDAHTALNHQIQVRLREQRLKLEALDRQKRALNPLHQVASQKKAFAQKKQQLGGALLKQLDEKKTRIAALRQHLAAVDPRRLLKRGYSIIFHEKSDSVILSTQNVRAGDRLRIQVSDGSLTATLDENL